jgi:DDE family transposase
LQLGLLWGWRLGKASASEHQHLRQLLPILPRRALLIGDAGFRGYDTEQSMIEAGIHFLIRVGSNVTLLTNGKPCGRCDQWVWQWPREAQERGKPPLRLRLLRIRARKGQRRYDVYLLTSVLEARRLTLEQASQLYRWRWQNEGMFRTYKRTLAKVKLLHRSARLIFREAEASLLATQLLLALGACGVNYRSRTSPQPSTEKTQECSPRKVLLAIRAEILAKLGPRQRCHFQDRLSESKLERRLQSSPKRSRPWTSRYDHAPPEPPEILKLTERQKQRMLRITTEKVAA